MTAHIIQANFVCEIEAIFNEATFMCAQLRLIQLDNMTLCLLLGRKLCHLKCFPGLVMKAYKNLCQFMISVWRTPHAFFMVYCKLFERTRHNSYMLDTVVAPTYSPYHNLCHSSSEFIYTTFMGCLGASWRERRKCDGLVHISALKFAKLQTQSTEWI